MLTRFRANNKAYLKWFVVERYLETVTHDSQSIKKTVRRKHGIAPTDGDSYVILSKRVNPPLIPNHFKLEVCIVDTCEIFHTI